MRLSRLGCSITLVSRTKHLLSDALDELSTDFNQKHEYLLYDLLKLLHEFGTSKTDQLAWAFSKSSILVNCAGMANYDLLYKLSSEAIASTLQLNLLSPILLSKMAIIPMIKLLRTSKVVPSILNISSMLSLSGVTIGGTTAYAALKAGLLGFTQSLLNELGGKVRVNAVMPALVSETDMGKSGLKSLPSVLLSDVIDTCEKVLVDSEYNGELIIADDKGSRNCRRFIG